MFPNNYSLWEKKDFHDSELFCRLTPAILFVTVVYAGLSNYFVHGPLSKEYYDFALPNCKTNWWVDATLFTNVIDYVRTKNCAVYGDCDVPATSVSLTRNNLIIELIKVLYQKLKIRFELCGLSYSPFHII